MITIRKEQKNDREAVYHLIQTSFETAEHSDGTEHELVERLRSSDAFIPELSLVAVNEANTIVGHILFTRAELRGTKALALAPLAVAPDCQRQGIGTLLINEGHRIAKELGYEWSVVLGSAQYYPRTGYRPASQFGIEAPFDVPDTNFMAYALQGIETPVHAVLAYAKEFFE